MVLCVFLSGACHNVQWEQPESDNCILYVICNSAISTPIFSSGLEKTMWNIAIIWSWKKEISWKMQQLLLLLGHQVWKIAFRIPVDVKHCWISPPVLFGSNVKLCVLQAFLFLEVLHHVVCTDYCSVAETSRWFGLEKKSIKTVGGNLEMFKMMWKLGGRFLCLLENPSISIKRIWKAFFHSSVWPPSTWCIHSRFLCTIKPELCGREWIILKVKKKDI